MLSERCKKAQNGAIIKFLENMRRPCNRMEQSFAKNNKKLQKSRIMKSPDKCEKTRTK